MVQTAGLNFLVESVCELVDNIVFESRRVARIYVGVFDHTNGLDECVGRLQGRLFHGRSLLMAIYFLLSL